MASIDGCGSPAVSTLRACRPNTGISGSRWGSRLRNAVASPSAGWTQKSGIAEPPVRSGSSGPRRMAASPFALMSASSRGVGRSISVRRGSSHPLRWRSRATKRMAEMLSPPRAKKLSSIPTSAAPVISPEKRAQQGFGLGPRRLRLRTRRRAGLAGQRPAVELAAGRRGRASSGTKAAGTMYSGRRSAERMAQGGGVGCRSWLRHDPGDQAQPPSGPGWASTAAWATPSRATRAASISPGSTRKPRSLTWSSARPRNSRLPSGRQRTRSPVRYMRCARRAEGTGDEPFRGQSRPARDSRGRGRCRRHRARPRRRSGTAPAWRRARRPGCWRSASRWSRCPDRRWRDQAARSVSRRRSPRSGRSR